MLTHLHELNLPGDVATCHAWNSDNSLLACCHGSPVVAIYSVKLGTDTPVELLASLREHNQLVSSMQWSHSNLLVTCSHDRTSYVWVKVCFCSHYSFLQVLVEPAVQHAVSCTYRMASHGHSRWLSPGCSELRCVFSGLPTGRSLRLGVVQRVAVYAPTRRTTSGGQAKSFGKHTPHLWCAWHGTPTTSSWQLAAQMATAECSMPTSLVRSSFTLAFNAAANQGAMLW